MRSTCKIALLLLSVVPPAMAGELRCIFQSRQICDPHGCTLGDPSGASVVLRLEERQYGRCGGERPCDWYPMRVRQGGDYLNLDFADGPQGAKMSLNGRTFIETVGIADRVWVGFGSCQP